MYISKYKIDIGTYSNSMKFDGKKIDQLVYKYAVFV